MGTPVELQSWIIYKADPMWKMATSRDDSNILTMEMSGIYLLSELFECLGVTFSPSVQDKLTQTGAHLRSLLGDCEVIHARPSDNEFRAKEVRITTYTRAPAHMIPEGIRHKTGGKFMLMDDMEIIYHTYKS
ncbi:uncharacterized protein Z518_07179 [Rhinocladiella mackenziei CBS 650.93]|uniref:Uncharacterized protein n=1 Tax=Rhinocladiella mackenziei CBS 650.93 TaxID=1442369 RepID=A0A0D2IK65_9EURO|nr:uncharacterized protein Z518_07179 [Rhinocladiella mackenziei CBS 650.93]KIX03626.1 hypothetical protein Z518_07179 [Rhinocladiella mackenziei CBS 650.93]